MNLKIFLILLSFITLFVSQAPQPMTLKYNILLTLKKFRIEPSRGLCKQIGMKKAQGKCFQINEGFLKLRRQNDSYSEKTLCGILKLPFCDGTCCLTGGFCKNSAILTDDDLKKSRKSECEKDQPILQVQCNSSGLLWCDGQCCGFSNKYHKCFRTNHYAVPYIRCPIQPSNE